MTISTRGGAPVELIAKYTGHDSGGGFVLIKAKISGLYPDGSGSRDIGKVLNEGDKTACGWSIIADFVADEGWQEISPVINSLPEEKPDNPAKIMNYYWPSVFDAKGNRRKQRR